MFSAGENTAPTAGMTGADWGGFGCQIASAAINATGQATCMIIGDYYAGKHYEAMEKLADAKMDSQLSAINAKSEQMQAVEEVTKHSNASSEELAQLESELRIGKLDLSEQEATREASRVDVNQLNAVFSRNDWFYGNPWS